MLVCASFVVISMRFAVIESILVRPTLLIFHLKVSSPFRYIEVGVYNERKPSVVTLF